MVEKTEITDKKQNIGKPWLFKPGKSGNPAGRPKGSLSLVSILKSKLEEVDPISKKKYAELFVEQILIDAAKEDGNSRRLALQYIEGMPKEQREVTHILPQPLLKLDEIHTNNSNQEDSSDDQENKSLTGGNSSVKDNIGADLLDS